MTPEVSVVIPTHNRLPCLRQCLDALAAQSFPSDRMEVIVVADGCTDGTESSLVETSFPFTLRVLMQPNSGPAAARNHGAMAASGALLLFLDDDIIASTGLVEAHTRKHTGEEEVVAVGPCLLAPPAGRDLYAEHHYAWWLNKIEAMARPHYHPTYQDVLGGNLSLQSSTFMRTGGFDPRFKCVEDPEYGLRLFAEGVRFVFAADAQARHLETTDLARSFFRARQEGYAHTQLSELYPEAFPTLPLSRDDIPSRWLSLYVPSLTEHVARVMTCALTEVERLQLRWLWARMYGRLRLYWYWRGVADYVGGTEGWEAWLQRMNANSPDEHEAASAQKQSVSMPD